MTEKKIDSLMAEITDYRRFQYLERRLTAIGSQVAGNQQFAADRTNDVLNQLDELRKDFEAMSERVDRMAEFLNTLREVKK